jgi:ribosomal protein L11 methyltransferase
MPTMTSTKLTLDTAERSLAMSVAGALQDLIEPPPEALTVFEERKGPDAPPVWRVEAFFTEVPDPETLTRELEALLGTSIPTFESAAVPDLNWVAISQAALPPVRAQRFTVHGSHDRSRIPQGPNAILIEAGEAFGTAHHATTYGCLLAIERLVARGPFHNILDLGCGSGILAIAAARAWPRARIAGVDIDAQSIVVARENATANRAGNRIEFVCGDGVDDPEIRRRAPFDLIIANILAKPLIMLSPDVRRSAGKGGIVVLSGLLTREAPAVIAAYRAQGFAIVDHRRHDGWSALTLVKRALA